MDIDFSTNFHGNVFNKRNMSIKPKNLKPHGGDRGRVRGPPQPFSKELLMFVQNLISFSFYFALISLRLTCAKAWNVSGVFTDIKSVYVCVCVCVPCWISKSQFQLNDTHSLYVSWFHVSHFSMQLLNTVKLECHWMCFTPEWTHSDTSPRASSVFSPNVSFL